MKAGRQRAEGEAQGGRTTTVDGAACWAEVRGPPGRGVGRAGRPEGTTRGPRPGTGRSARQCSRRVQERWSRGRDLYIYI